MKIRIRRLRFDINFLFLLLATFYIYTDYKKFFLLFFSALMHEVGHLVSIILLEKKISNIKIDIFRIKITRISEIAEENWAKLIILLSGPAVNLIFCFVAKIIKKVFNIQNSYLNLLIINNFFLFFVNILPINGLDGGSVFSLILGKKFGVIRGIKVANVIFWLFFIAFLVIMIFINKYYIFLN